MPESTHRGGQPSGADRLHRLLTAPNDASTPEARLPDGCAEDLDDTGLALLSLLSAPEPTQAGADATAPRAATPGGPAGPDVDPRPASPDVQAVLAAIGVPDLTQIDAFSDVVASVLAARRHVGVRVSATSGGVLTLTAPSATAVLLRADLDSVQSAINDLAQMAGLPPVHRISVQVSRRRR